VFWEWTHRADIVAKKNTNQCRRGMDNRFMTSKLELLDLVMSKIMHFQST